MRVPSYKLTMAASAAAVVLAATSAYAVSDHANARAQRSNDPSASPTASASPSHGKGKGRLAAGKLDACHQREAHINSILTRIVTRGTKQIAVFDTIATRVETFYTDKGKTLSNYDALVKNVDDAKNKAETDLAAMKTTANFQCDGTDPKGSAAVFQGDLKLEIADLKAYKTAVKNLIVGVKSVQSDAGASDSGTESPSPSSPSSSPTASPTASASPTSSPEGGQQ